MKIAEKHPTQQAVHHQFPWSVVLFRGLLALTFTASSLKVMSGAGHAVFIVYITLMVFTFSAILFFACRHCDYYGKRCDLGISLLVSRLFRQGSRHDLFEKTGRLAKWPMIILVMAPLSFGLIHAMDLASPREALPFLLSGLSLGLIVMTSAYWRCPRCLKRDQCPFVPHKSHSF